MTCQRIMYFYFIYKYVVYRNDIMQILRKNAMDLKHVRFIKVMFLSKNVFGRVLQPD